MTSLWPLAMLGLWSSAIPATVLTVESQVVCPVVSAAPLILLK